MPALEINKSHFASLRWIDDPAMDLASGQVRCAIQRCALTANNITYAATGDEIGYWRFFPATEEGWGRLPVWGFADVADSRNDAISVGERLYGFWPLASNLVMTASHVRPEGLRDQAPHRTALPMVYNQYARCQADPVYSSDTEAEQAVFRPLFMTSFMLDDFLADNDFFGADQVILSSASSKTAIGTAFCLRQRSDRRAIGLTSAGNLEFVRSLGLYDAVLTYADIEDIERTSSVYVDMAGNTALRRRIHTTLNDMLKFSSAVGYSHLGTMQRGEKMPGPAPTFFFAPSQIEKRANDWRDSGGVHGHHLQAWRAFLPTISTWMTLQEHAGRPGIEAIYQRTLAGEAAPDEGHTIALGSI